MTGSLFIYGTLCHAPLREAVLGLGHSVSEARLAGWRVHWAAGEDYPVLLRGEPGDEAVGLLVEGLSPEARARADFFELGFGYKLEAVEIEVDGRGPTPALAYLPVVPVDTGRAWDLEAWVRDWSEIWLEATDEAMRAFNEIDAAALARRWPMIKLRAATRLRAAAQPQTHRVRADFTAAKDVEIVTERRPYTEYFSLEDHDLRHRRFDGAMSPVLRRAGFVGGDAATVLPYDPVSDRVLIVEQFRMGPYLRGDQRPWMLEPVAGRVDPGESPEDCVKREAVEEAGITLGRLHKVADYYPSPGAVTEFVFSFVGEADLSGMGGTVGGLDGEDEDIHAHVISFAELMALIESGEVNTGPLVLSALWLAANRDRLRGRPS